MASSRKACSCSRSRSVPRHCSSRRDNCSGPAADPSQHEARAGTIKKNSLEPLNLSISETADEVVVHHADRLHVRIHDGRTDEAEPAVPEILTERVGFV